MPILTINANRCLLRPQCCFHSAVGLRLLVLNFHDPNLHCYYAGVFREMSATPPPY